MGFGDYSGFDAFPVKLYEVATGRETDTFPGPKGGVNDLAFHPDGRHLAVAGSEVVEVWDVAGHTKVHELRGHSKWVYGVAFSPDGKWLATGGWDRTIKLWDAATGEERLTIFGHEGFVLDLAFSPDSRSLASTGEDRSVRLWEVPTGRPIGVVPRPHRLRASRRLRPRRPGAGLGRRGGHDEGLGPADEPPGRLRGAYRLGRRLWYRRDGRRVVSAAIGYQVPR